MLTLRPTKMLARRLGIALPAAAPPVENRIADWCVHEFREGGCRFLILVNTATLFPLFTHARGVIDDGALIEACIASMRLNFIGTEREFHYQRWIAPELGEVQWAPIPGRSVLSSINELVFLSRHERDKSPVELSEWLAQVPLSAIGHDFPARAFAKLMNRPARPA